MNSHHPLKSNCLIANQSGWASIVMNYSDRQIQLDNLPRYFITIREHDVVVQISTHFDVHHPMKPSPCYVLIDNKFTLLRFDPSLRLPLGDTVRVFSL